MTKDERSELRLKGALYDLAAEIGWQETVKLLDALKRELESGAWKHRRG